jgi:hypothetical protein
VSRARALFFPFEVRMAGYRRGDRFLVLLRFASSHHCAARSCANPFRWSPNKNQQGALSPCVASPGAFPPVWGEKVRVPARKSFLVLLRLVSSHRCAAPFLCQSIPLEPKQEPAGYHEAPLALCGKPGRCFSCLG